MRVGRTEAARGRRLFCVLRRGEMEQEEIAGASNGQLQVRKSKRTASWTDPAKLRKFFDHLSITSNVKASCEHAGLVYSSAHRARRTDAEVRDRWEMAIEEARGRVRELVQQQAIAEIEPPDGGRAEGEARIPDARLALALLKLHDPRGAHASSISGRPRREMTTEELRARLAERLAAVSKRLRGGR